VVRRPYYLTQYTKLRIWEFDDYDKLMYLDADTLVLQNRDHLFDMLPPNQIMGEGSGVKIEICQVVPSACN
jgi:alpha-N-acetylglucosamine transferase